MNAPLLKVRNLVKEFGNFRAVSGLTFDVDLHQVLGLLGPNGAGKTTTLRMLSGFLTPTQGDIFIAGCSMREHPLTTRSQIGYLPESVPLYKEMKVSEYLSFIGGLRGLSRGGIKKERERLLEDLELQNVSSRLIGKLSKGYKQRVGLAQAWMGNPRLILLDEPTSGLDPEQTVEIRMLIAKIKETSCVILSTHILSEVEKMADRVLILNEGAIAASGSPAELSRRLAAGKTFRLAVRGAEEKIFEVFDSMPEILSARKRFEKEGILYFSIQTGPEKEIQPQIVQRLVHNGLELIELAEEEAKLEKIFLQLIH
ncbi:MAG: ABC transporter ATP-binding protein [Candidatus Omnitrophica bacterium]|nr:ABC transporter ATP-binding protein [Candidatus Omnitrophota bacterium]